MKSVFTCIIIIFAIALSAQSVTFNITGLPSNHPVGEDVYIAGTFNGWQPGHPDYKMTRNNDNTYSFTLTGTGSIAFKFTRGSWAKVEKGSNCQEIANRTYVFGQSPVVNVTVQKWADLCGGSHTAQANVHVLDDNFFIPQLNRSRRVWIYLPPGYDTSGISYPVLYMQDGQNLFDAFYSFAGEWEVDETLNRMFSEGGQPCIVVGIDNGGTHRINEYSPWINPNYGGGEGDLYAGFLTETLKPHIDSLYRTLPDRNNTAVMGSSLGALISFYTGIKYQDIFSKVGIFSPSFWFSPQCYTFAAQTTKTHSMRLYFLAGGLESGVTEHCNRMMDTLSVAGYADEEMQMKTVPNGQHSEWFWRQEFRPAFEWLFTQNTGSEPGKKSSGFIKPLFPNPTSGMVYIRSDRDFNEDILISQATLKSFYGSFHSRLPVHKWKGLLAVDLSAYPDGIYVLSLELSSGPESRLVVKNSGYN